MVTVDKSIDRDFGRLFRATTVSRLGSEISELAVPLLLILSLDASGSQVGFLRAAQFLPFLLFTLHAGVLVDRVRRRGLMIGADLVRFGLIGAIPVAVWLGLSRPEPLYVLVFLAGAATVVHQLADQAYLPGLVGRDRVLAANSRIGAAQSAADLSGQGVGGALVAWLTAPVAVLVDAFTYLYSALTLSRIRHREAPVGGSAGPVRVRDGLAFLVRSRYLRALVGEAAAYNIGYQVFSIGLLLWLARDLRLSPAIIGLVISLGAIGAFGGAAFGARLSARYGYGRTMLVTMAVGNGAPLALFAPTGSGTTTVVLLSAVYLVMGFGTAVANVHNISLRQTAVPDAIQGRVTAAYRLVSWGCIPLGSVLGGLLDGALGHHGAVLTGAVVIASATLFVALSPIPRLRQAPRTEELQPGA